MQFPIASCSLSYQPWWNPNGFSHPLKMEDSPTTKNDCDCDGHWIGFVGKKTAGNPHDLHGVYTMASGVQIFPTKPTPNQSNGVNDYMKT